MIISIIVAADEQNGIGINNQLPWRLSADLKYFKQLTTGHYIIMGRNTFESIGKPLPNRVNIVLSSKADYNPGGVILQSNLPEAIDFVTSNGDNECMIIGGAQLYKQAITIADRIYLTRVHALCNCDVYFPVISSKDWKLMSTVRHRADDKNEYDYSFEVYERIKADK